MYSQLQQERLEREFLADLRRREAAGIKPPIPCRVISFGGKKPKPEPEEHNESDDRLVEL